MKIGPVQGRLPPPPRDGGLRVKGAVLQTHSASRHTGKRFHCDGVAAGRTFLWGGVVAAVAKNATDMGLSDFLGGC